MASASSPNPSPNPSHPPPHPPNPESKIAGLEKEIRLRDRQYERLARQNEDLNRHVKELEDLLFQAQDELENQSGAPQTVASSSKQPQEELERLTAERDTLMARLRQQDETIAKLQTVADDMHNTVMTVAGVVSAHENEANAIQTMVTTLRSSGWLEKSQNLQGPHLPRPSALDFSRQEGSSSSRARSRSSSSKPTMFQQRSSVREGKRPAAFDAMFREGKRPATFDAMFRMQFHHPPPPHRSDLGHSKGIVDNDGQSTIQSLERKPRSSKWMDTEEDESLDDFATPTLFPQQASSITLPLRPLSPPAEQSTQRPQDTKAEPKEPSPFPIHDSGLEMARREVAPSTTDVGIVAAEDDDDEIVFDDDEIDFDDDPQSSTQIGGPEETLQRPVSPLKAPQVDPPPSSKESKSGSTRKRGVTMDELLKPVTAKPKAVKQEVIAEKKSPTLFPPAPKGKEAVVSPSAPTYVKVLTEQSPVKTDDPRTLVAQVLAWNAAHPLPLAKDIEAWGSHGTTEKGKFVPPKVKPPEDI
ncbi:MAG: hypothetical protein Q9219_002508 [cf. Caloplaca sp. 3 TL-2023]